MWSFLQSGNMVAVKIILFLCFAFNLKLGLGLSYPMAMKYNEPSGWNKPKALCPYGPCEVPQCCQSGIAVKTNANVYSQHCPERGCFTCLSQQYLLGLHERCSMDQTIMKSLCAPGLSCLIYCNSKYEGVQACWNKYGTCQHNHVQELAKLKFPGNITQIPGLTKQDAKRAPLCSRERTVCHCRGNRCNSHGKGKPWCFLAYVKHHNNPRENCYADAKWSSTYGSFYSSEACLKLMSSMKPAYNKPANPVYVGNALGMRSAADTGSDNGMKSGGNNLDMAAAAAAAPTPVPTTMPPTTTTTTTTTTAPPASQDPMMDDFYWNFSEQDANLKVDNVSAVATSGTEDSGPTMVGGPEVPNPSMSQTGLSNTADTVDTVGNPDATAVQEQVPPAVKPHDELVSSMNVADHLAPNAGGQDAQAVVQDVQGGEPVAGVGDGLQAEAGAGAGAGDHGQHVDTSALL